MDLETKERLLFILIVLTGIGLIIGGFFYFKDSLKFKNNAIEIEATVKDVSKHTDSDDKTEYKLKVSYYVDRKEYIGNISIENRIKNGDKIKIYYDKNNPKEISTTNIKIEGITTIFIGIIFCIFGFGLLFKK